MTLTTRRTRPHAPVPRVRTHRHARLVGRAGAASAPAVAGPEFRALRSRIDGQVVLPGDPEWDAARRAWNLSVDGRLAAVALVSSIGDAVGVVEFAHAHGLRIAPQGGEWWGIGILHSDGADTGGAW